MFDKCPHAGNPKINVFAKGVLCRASTLLLVVHAGAKKGDLTNRRLLPHKTRFHWHHHHPPTIRSLALSGTMLNLCTFFVTPPFVKP
jgi:hypothetical protein